MECSDCLYIATGNLVYVYMPFLCYSMLEIVDASAIACKLMISSDCYQNYKMWMKFDTYIAILKKSHFLKQCRTVW